MIIPLAGWIPLCRLQINHHLASSSPSKCLSHSSYISPLTSFSTKLLQNLPLIPHPTPSRGEPWLDVNHALLSWVPTLLSPSSVTPSMWPSPLICSPLCGLGDHMRHDQSCSTVCVTLLNGGRDRTGGEEIRVWLLPSSSGQAEGVGGKQESFSLLLREHFIVLEYQLLSQSSEQIQDLCFHFYCCLHSFGGRETSSGNLARARVFHRKYLLSLVSCIEKTCEFQKHFANIHKFVYSRFVIVLYALGHSWQTQCPRAESRPPPCFIQPAP